MPALPADPSGVVSGLVIEAVSYDSIDLLYLTAKTANGYALGCVAGVFVMVPLSKTVE